MNLDELKSAWNNDGTNDVSIPETIEQLKKAQHPLDKLKRNMKNEWIMQLIAIIALGFIPQLQGFVSSLYIFYYVAYSLLVIVSVYYLSRFKAFYTQITHYSSDTKDSLTEIYHEFRLNIERYHSFGFLLLPFALVWVGVYIQNDLMLKGKDLSSLSNDAQKLLIVAVIVIILLFVVAILGWTKYYYGKYLKQLKAVLDELKSN